MFFAKSIITRHCNNRKCDRLYGRDSACYDHVCVHSVILLYAVSPRRTRPCESTPYLSLVSRRRRIGHYEPWSCREHVFTDGNAGM